MGKGSSLAWANFLQTIGQQAPGIIQRYDEQQTAYDLKQKDLANKKSVSEIMRGMPQVGSPVLDEMAGGMDPQTATKVLQLTPPEVKRQALETLRLSVPQNTPTAPGAEGALRSFAEPRKQQTPTDMVEAIRPIIRSMEEDKTLGYKTLHPKDLKGRQALGAYGISPSSWWHAFPEYGLDANNPEHIQKFLNSPQIQDEMFAKIAQRGLQDTGGDPRKFRAWYYSGPKTAAKLGTGQDWEYKPQHAMKNGKIVEMPSIGADADAFVKRLQDAGMDTTAAMDLAKAATPADLPWDNSMLESLVKDRPTMKTLPKKVTYGDQERYLLSKVKNPEVLALLKDYIGAVSGLAKGERETVKQSRDDYEKDMTQYGENVRKDSELHFNTWKEGQTAKENALKRKDETLSALRTQRESLQKQLGDLRSFEQRAGAGKEPTELLSAAYPEYYTTAASDPSWFAQVFQGGDANPTMETKLDAKKLTQRSKDIQAEIDGIDQEVSRRSKAPSISNTRPPEGNPLSKYMTPRK